MQKAQTFSKGSTPLDRAKRVVIKIGSALLVDGDKNEIRQVWLQTLAEDVAACHARGQEVVLVSSGAIALGRRILKLQQGALLLEQSQAAAACGQIRLAHAYQDVLAHHNIRVAQVLLTLGDTENRQSYLNVRATLRTLLEMGVVPVINENDTVATAEIRYGDNDRLAARVAAMIEADCLVLLSDIDGLYTADPSVDPQAKFLPIVEKITPEIMAMAGDSRSGLGRGGMITKLEAAKIVVQAGGAMVIAKGAVLHPVATLLSEALCTWFLPSCTPAAARKVWISGSLHSKGTLTIDEGAVKALKQGKSLLAAGVKQVEGSFRRGDSVRIVSLEGVEIARGLIAYNHEEATLIQGRKSDTFESLLGYHGPDEMIHRDDLAVR